MSSDRTRAVELRAVSLSELLTKAGMPGVLALLSAADVQQLQRYLDAAVVDPAITQQARALYRANPAAQRQTQALMRQYIPVGRLDDAVRLDLSKLLDPKALAPITDNPDEADYLAAVGEKLKGDGVWLRISPRLTRDPDDPSQWIDDGRHFDVWLSLGARGDVISAKNGRIDREALLSAQVIGANYWRRVVRGPMLNAINQQGHRLNSEIFNAISLHWEIVKMRTVAWPGAAVIADAVGGAELPGFDTLTVAGKLLERAYKLRDEGKVWGAGCLMTIDALLVRNAVRELTTYLDKSNAGAAAALKGAKIIGLAVLVVETILSAGLALAATGEAATGEVAMEAGAKRAGSYLARHPEIDAELKSMRVVRMGGGNILRAGQRAGVGFHVW